MRLLQLIQYDSSVIQSFLTLSSIVVNLKEEHKNLSKVGSHYHKKQSLVVYFRVDPDPCLKIRLTLADTLDFSLRGEKRLIRVTNIEPTVRSRLGLVSLLPILAAASVLVAVCDVLAFSCF